jgi:hypothetical protein
MNMKTITVTLTVPAHMSETELRSRISMLVSPDWLTSFWSIEDVKEVADHLSDDECRAVLDRVESNHDAEVGINWDVLRFHAEQVTI